jgi:7-cyano-7-deazaguanine synthase
MSDGIAVVSGGLDSVTLLYHLVAMGYNPDVISFNYLQRHRKELDYAQAAAERLNLRWDCIDIGRVGEALAEGGSALVDIAHSEVPEGHYAEENMKQTVVPNRNAIMATIATGVCVARGGQYVALAPHNGDAAIYPDCRPAFWREFEAAMKLANEGFVPREWGLLTPFIKMSKTDIASVAMRLQVPLALTWSCYKGDKIHCGRCGTCVERLEAIHDSGAFVYDETAYEDENYWRTQIEKASTK